LITAISGIAHIRTHFAGTQQEMLRILLNSTSIAEANIALDLLSKHVPESVLIAACNMREVIAELPASPFTMSTDEQTLCRVAGLTHSTATMGKVLEDGTELVVTTAGNLVLDIIVRRDGVKYFWNPIPVTDDYVNDGILDLLIESDCLLKAVIELATAMGMVFNPTFYLSLEDWHMDYASDLFAGLRDLF
jgi:hypothetical protein